MVAGGCRLRFPRAATKRSNLLSNCRLSFVERCAAFPLLVFGDQMGSKPIALHVFYNAFGPNPIPHHVFYYAVGPKPMTHHVFYVVVGPEPL